MSSTGAGAPFDVRVTLDLKPLDPTQAGPDIQLDEEGNTFIRVTRSDMYRMVKIPELGGHLLYLSFSSSDFSVLAHTLGSYLERPASS